jgi:type IV pilus assembly protein PilW
MNKPQSRNARPYPRGNILVRHGQPSAVSRLRPQPNHRQSGFTLIEVLVSLTIGLTILIAISAVYISSGNLARQRESQAEMNQPARILARQLQYDIAMAGYTDIFDFGAGTTFQAASLFTPGNADLANLYQRVPDGTVQQTPLGIFFPGLLPVFGCSGAMNSSPNGLVTGALPVALSCGTANVLRHSLQIAYQATPATTPDVMVSLLPDNAATGVGRDCLQQGSPGTGTPAQNKFVINRYFVQANATDGTSELYCAGSGNSIPQPMVRGVEEFTLRYQLAQSGVAVAGTPTPAAGGGQARYADAVAVADTAVNPLGWANVTAVELCMTLATAATSGASQPGVSQLQPARPTCARGADGRFADDVVRTAGDSRLWKRFTTVVTVRNAVFSTPN